MSLFSILAICYAIVFIGVTVFGIIKFNQREKEERQYNVEILDKYYKVKYPFGDGCFLFHQLIAFTPAGNVRLGRGKEITMEQLTESIRRSRVK